MLVLTRKQGEIIRITQDPGLDPATPIGEVFSAGAIAIQVSQIRRTQVKLGIYAHPQLLILREEHYCSWVGMAKDKE